MSNSKRKNFGFGRQMAYAIRAAIADHFGPGRYGTRYSHIERLRLFEHFLRELGVQDLRDINSLHMDAFVDDLAQKCSHGKLASSTATNRISSVNVLLSTLPGRAELMRSARELNAARDTSRVDEPMGISPIVVDAAINELLEANEVRLAVVVAFARYAGGRFKEASLFDLRKGRRTIARDGEVVISAGTKGGRGKSIPRRIVAEPRLSALLNSSAVLELGQFVVPPTWNYKRWYEYAHRAWGKCAPVHGLSTKFHDFRAAYACARYQQLVGRPAPCALRMYSDIRSVRGTPCLTDAEARQIIAVELGHGRARITDSYVGASQ